MLTFTVLNRNPKISGPGLYFDPSLVGKSEIQLWYSWQALTRCRKVGNLEDMGKTSSNYLPGDMYGWWLEMIK
jgi:hypothetical protein